MLRKSFAGAAGQNIRFKEVIILRKEYVLFRVVLIEYAGVIKVLIYPVSEILKHAEINYESARVCFMAGECQRDRPIVAVYKRTVACVAMLPVSEWDIAVGFFAGEHYLGTRLSVSLGCTLS